MDSRRSINKGRAPLEQIQISLGHASIQTTERYLGVTQDLTDAPCDHLGIRGASEINGRTEVLDYSKPANPTGTPGGDPV